MLVATVALLIATVTIPVATVTIVATIATTAAATLRCQILGGYIANRDDLYLEVEGLARHRVVEVHLHALLANLANDAEHAVALSIAHGYLRTYEEDILYDFAIDHEDSLGQLNQSVGNILTVAIFGLQSKCHLLAGLLAENSLLELGKEHACTKDKLQGLTRARLVCYLTIDCESVVHSHHFVLFYFHSFYRFFVFYNRFVERKYNEFSTFGKIYYLCTP